MTMMRLPDPPSIRGRLWQLLRADRSLRYKVLAIVGAGLAGIAYLLGHGPMSLRPLSGASITPITNTSGGASGISFSGDAYDVSCTASAATGTMYPALHDGTAWTIYYTYPCSYDGSVVTKVSCIFPARRAVGGEVLTWNAFKTGSATLSSCTAQQRYNGSPFPSAPPPATSAAFTPVVTKITSGSGNWTPTAGATIVRVICVGGGGGGGSGRQGTSGSSVGGGGGGGGGTNERTMPVADLSVPVAYSVGAGGPGGAAQASGATSGNPGTSGGATTFGLYCRGGGGIAGSGGTSATGTQGAGGQGLWGGTGYGGGGSNTTGINAETANPYVSSWSITTPGGGATGGGGGGGGHSTAAGLGGNGGTRVSQGGTAAAGGASTGAAGTPGTGSMLPFGYGGGGGAGGTAGTAGGAGGAGATYGGGGGGGGGSVTGAASGAGGDGASGTIWIFESHLMPANDNATPTRMVA